MTRVSALEGSVWIYGFWTGLIYVAAASDQTQAKIDVAAIVAEVEKTCVQQTSQTLASAVWTTYLGSEILKGEKRPAAILAARTSPRSRAKRSIREAASLGSL
jgi:hypothetical protein